MAATGPPAAAPGAIPTLALAIEDAAHVDHAAVPTLRFVLRVDTVGGHDVRSILLDAQIQIAARRRTYGPADHDRLFELFGPSSEWGTNLRTLLWTRQTLVVPPFSDSTSVDLDVPCTYDLDVAASRYFDALDDGEVPVEFLFSGTVFYTGTGGLLQTVRIPWDVEAEYRLPVAVWKQTMDRHFPGTAWLRLRKDTFDRLSAFRSRRALASWEDAVDTLLDERGGG